MNNFFNTAKKHILIKDMSDVIDCNLISSEFDKLTFKKNVINDISENINFFDAPAFAATKLALEHECAGYLQNAYNVQQFEKLEITHSWGNITNPGEGHHDHNHPFSVVSGVLFLDDNLDNLNLHIESYLPDIPHFWYRSKSFISLKELLEKPEGLKNHLVMFLSNSDHFVSETDISSKPRKSVAFNTFWKGRVGAAVDGLGSYNFK